MSRASVSFDRQAVAPNDSIWLHSAAVGRLASTTMRVAGWARWSWSTRPGLPSAAEVQQRHVGPVAFDLGLDGLHRHALSDQLEVRILGDEDAQADGHEILELGTENGRHQSNIGSIWGYG